MIIVTDKKPRFDITQVLSAAEITEIQHFMHHYPDPRAASLDALKIVQKTDGWVNDEKLAAVAQLLGISSTDVEGVATFYNRIYRQPVGRHVILQCDSVACYLTGAEDLAEQLRFKLGIDFGQTTADGKYTLLPICCLGNCDKGPTLMIDEDTHDVVTAESLVSILEAYE